MGEPIEIVEIKVALCDHFVTISQHRYLESILQKEGMDRAKPVSMPLEHEIKLVSNPYGNASDRSNSHAWLTGKLESIANTTKPGIAHAISRLSSYTVNPSKQRVSGCCDTNQEQGSMGQLMETYLITQIASLTDASLANLDDRKSNAGLRYVFKIAEDAMTWHTRRQSVIVLSVWKPNTSPYQKRHVRQDG